MSSSKNSQCVSGILVLAFVLPLSLLYLTFHAEFGATIRPLLPISFGINGDSCIIPPFLQSDAASFAICQDGTITCEKSDNKIRHITTIPTHVQGFTVLENVYLRNGTFFIVHPDSASAGSSSQATGYPQRRNMITKVVDYGNGGDFNPTDEELMFISASNASEYLGSFARRINGVSLLIYDPVQFMHHFYHWWGEIILGAWRVYSTVNHNTSVSNSFPPTWSQTEPMRFLLPFSEDGAWRDRAGVNGPLMRAAFPSASIEVSDYWSDLQKLDSAVVFDRLMLVNRQAAHFHPNGGVWFKMIAGSMSVNASKGFWEPLRDSLIRGLLGSVPSVNERGAVVDLDSHQDNSLPLVTYISRQSGGRRLTDQDHEGLVQALLDLEKEGVCKVRVVRMETLTLHEQVDLAARSTVIVGVHGNGLTHQLWMPSSRWSTVMEIFRPQVYVFDYEILSRNAGHRHYAVWNDTLVTYPEGTYHEGLNYGENFNGNDIPVYGPAVASKIRERLALP
ncbi:hypothetical protein AX17_006049 [Amanita inopinata Kibby_2008]|nr:hypothetical protein AX17_006049 [Amanita inopinata Kibby_2008]